MKSKHPTPLHSTIAAKQTAIRHRHGTGQFKPAPKTDQGLAIAPAEEPGELCDPEPLDTPITPANPWRPGYAG